MILPWTLAYFWYLDERFVGLNLIPEISFMIEEIQADNPFQTTKTFSLEPNEI